MFCRALIPRRLWGQMDLIDVLLKMAAEMIVKPLTSLTYPFTHISWKKAYITPLPERSI